jgi:aminoglycoside phosphotransferase (APT) family kinase protein
MEPVWTLDDVSASLEKRWGCPILVDRVFDDHFDRLVFSARRERGDDTPIVVKADLNAPQTANERHAMRAFAAHGIPVPQLLDCFDDITVMTLEVGEELSGTSPDAHWRAVAAAVREIHDKVPADGFEPFWPTMRHDVAREIDNEISRRMLPDRVRPILIDIVESGLPDEPRRTVIHGDNATYHWLLRHGHVGAVIDLANAGVGDPVVDLAVLTEWNRDRLPVVLDGYGADSAFRSYVERTHTAHRVTRQLGTLWWLESHGVDATPTAQDLIRTAESA